MKEITKIELGEKDIKELVAEKFNLDPNTCRCIINHYEGDRPGEASYTSIVVEGSKKQALVDRFPDEARRSVMYR